jgi:hypothetical protein
MCTLSWDQMTSFHRTIVQWTLQLILFMEIWLSKIYTAELTWITWDKWILFSSSSLTKRQDHHKTSKHIHSSPVLGTTWLRFCHWKTWSLAHNRVKSFYRTCGYLHLTQKHVLIWILDCSKLGMIQDCSWNGWRHSFGLQGIRLLASSLLGAFLLALIIAIDNGAADITYWLNLFKTWSGYSCLVTLRLTDLIFREICKQVRHLQLLRLLAHLATLIGILLQDLSKSMLIQTCPLRLMCLKQVTQQKSNQYQTLFST